VNLYFAILLNPSYRIIGKNPQTRYASMLKDRHKVAPSLDTAIREIYSRMFS
jgi:hypothetical protein